MEMTLKSKLKSKCNAKWILILLVGFSMKGFSQIPIGIEVNIMEPYPTKYALWAAGVDSYFFTVTNNSDIAFDYYILLSFEGFDANFTETYARINQDFVPAEPFTIYPGATEIITSSDIIAKYSNISLADVDLSDNLGFDLAGELPSGDYTMCANVRGYPQAPGDVFFLSPQDCSEPFVISQNNIELLSPIDGDIVYTEVESTFQWHVQGSLGGPPAGVSYEFSLYEIDSLSAENESVYDMIRSGEAYKIHTEITTDTYYNSVSYTHLTLPTKRIV